MLTIPAVELPPQALLAGCRAQQAYTDCYAMELPRTVSLADYIEAFYTSPLFKLERALLAAFAARGGTLRRLSVARAAPVGGMHGWRAAMPVTQWAWTQP